MQIKVGAAPPTELAQLQRWVDRADRAVAALAPREPQAPPAAPPVRHPRHGTASRSKPCRRRCNRCRSRCQPGALPGQSTLLVVLLPPIRYGAVGLLLRCQRTGVPSTAGACRGRLYQYRADAYAQCRTEEASVAPTTACSRRSVAVHGHFLATTRQASGKACAAPAGYCCIDRRLTPMNRDQCKGTFYTDARVGGQACAGEREPAGYCCADGQVRPERPDALQRQLLRNEAGARKACSAPQRQRGWCCAGGECRRRRRTVAAVRSHSRNRRR
jgi:hypothetical protein